MLWQLQLLEGVLLCEAPGKLDVFLCEVEERSSVMRKPFNEPVIEISEPDKGLNFLFVRRGWPFRYAGNLDRIHLDLVVQDDHTKIFNAGLFEFALLVPEVQVVFAHAIQDGSSDSMVLFEGVREDEDVIEVNRDDTLCDEVLKDLVHHSLEGHG